MKYFVMVCMVSGDPAPLCESQTEPEIAHLFDSRDEATQAALANPIAIARGYTVYPWEWTE
jgi:hypothetical protein